MVAGDSRFASQSDIGFSSEIYFGIHQFGNEFFLNRVSFKRKQAHPQPANRNHAKIRNHKMTLSFQGQKKSYTEYALYSTLSLKTISFHFFFQLVF